MRLPARCKVLVVGAGPAGSACALELARQGVEVLLVDAQPFPRDKVCGDGLIPDAHRALQALGVHDEVMAASRSLSKVACFGPSGSNLSLPGQLAVLPRMELDDVLRRAAERAGAAFVAPARFVAPLREAGRVSGAELHTTEGQRSVQADWTVLATGAAAQPLLAAGVCQRRSPSAMALRGYLHHPAPAPAIEELQVVWHRALRGGYGWIFPCRHGVFNIGVGVMAPRAASGSLHQMLQVFGQSHGPARELLAGGRWLGKVKGAPLRCSLQGALPGVPGMLVVGDAIGSTYAFTGEGIGKALETGRLAAQALVQGGADAAVVAGHNAQVQALAPHYALYERAQRISRHPWLADLLIWRAQRSPAARERMAGVLDETVNPGQLVSAGGLARLLLPFWR